MQTFEFPKVRKVTSYYGQVHVFVIENESIYLASLTACGKRFGKFKMLAFLTCRRDFGTIVAVA